MTFAIITDSTADLDESWASQHDVTLLGLTITMEDKTYETVGPDRLTSDLLLERMKEGAKPTTSQINVGTFEETFRRLAQEGRDILYLAFSSVLSGTYQSATIARDMVLEDYPKARIEIIDTLAAAGGEGYLSILASQERDKGTSLDDTMALIADIIPRLRTFFLVDDLYHLMRGGRLSKSSAIIGSLVNIKPLLWLDAAGKLVPLSKLRGRKKGMKEMLARATEDLGHATAIVAYANDEASAMNLKAQLLETDGIDDVLILPLGPVISAHVGPDTLAIFTIGKTAR
ncbi:DegV family protein [Streptococcus saliviloxodontae]|uniref:DegV family protein with EDD domain n=1 Tax=Streptococcus saliviloxodontae TaxID=1349416 RepID=A0ABS2PKJ0_9STRE|nr:DegV family protein [Streptococcus saliviloxodontae]MBM7635945.1 DegV family protein with EDD domain [Streptococcus saliviloxodontae]